MRRLSLALLVPLALAAGCVGLSDDERPGENLSAQDANETPITPVQERHEKNFTIDEDPSNTLEEGPYEVLDGLGVRVNVELPATEGGGAATDSAEVHMGVFLPDIPGCNWESLDLGDSVDLGEVIEAEDSMPEKCKVPVVADIGPYYTTSAERRNHDLQVEGDTVATEPAERLGGFLIRQLVPHGYAVAQVSVFGTGDSGHCMDLMGESEQAGIDAAVEFLGEAEFSNGNVGLIGRSYDGSTPWEAAATPAANDHLKTIAPISGLIGVKDLMWRNGSAESRGGSGVLWALYYGFAPDGTAEDAEHLLCPDATLQGSPQHGAAYATGGDMGPASEAYWAERNGFLDRALENYNGSVYLIQGLQDWNVDPHMAFPTFEILQDNGIETKGLFGQWAHNYPDRLEEHQSCDGRENWCSAPTSVRHDWAQDLLEWFDHYLKETGEKPQLHAEVQDNQGHWRVEETYPPDDAQQADLTLDEAEVTGGREVVFGQTAKLIFAEVSEGTNLSLQFEPLSQDNWTRIAGMPTFHVQVTPTGPGGQLYAELRDAETHQHLGHAIMDLRYHEGGDEMQPVVPGQPITAKMQFQAMDIALPPGHGLELLIAPEGMDYMSPAVNDPVEVHLTEDSTLSLPIVERSADEFFLPPGHADELGTGVPPDATGDPGAGVEDEG